MKRGANNRRGFTLVELLAVWPSWPCWRGCCSRRLAGRRPGRGASNACPISGRPDLGFTCSCTTTGTAFPCKFRPALAALRNPSSPPIWAAPQFSFSFTHFQALSNDLATPRIFACPADPKRSPADDFAALNNRHLSYFVGANADYQLPNSLLAGDRNLVSAAPVPKRRDTTLVRLDDATPANWGPVNCTVSKGTSFCRWPCGARERPGAAIARRNAPLVMDLILPTLKPPHAAPAALASVARNKTSAKWKQQD